MRLHSPTRTRAQDEAYRARVPQPTSGAAFRRRALVAGRTTHREAGVTNGVVHGSRATTARPIRSVDARGQAPKGIYGGFSAVYDVLKALEDAGRIRRGYFVGGVGATQFALPGRTRADALARDMPDEPEVLVLAATDPANPYGTMLKWPEQETAVNRLDAGPTRTVGSQVVFVNGLLAAYIPRGGRQVMTAIPEDEPQRSGIARPLALRLVAIARGRREP